MNMNEKDEMDFNKKMGNGREPNTNTRHGKINSIQNCVAFNIKLWEDLQDTAKMMDRNMTATIHSLLQYAINNEEQITAADDPEESGYGSEKLALGKTIYINKNIDDYVRYYANCKGIPLARTFQRFLCYSLKHKDVAFLDPCPQKLPGCYITYTERMRKKIDEYAATKDITRVGAIGELLYYAIQHIDEIE